MSTIFDSAETFVLPVSERKGDNAEAKSDFIFEDWFTPPTLNGKEIPLFKPVLGLNKFDILPFVLGSNLLAGSFPNKTEGTVAYDVTVDVHMKWSQGKKIQNLVSRDSLKLGGDPFPEEKFAQFKLAAKEKTTSYWKRAVSLFPKSRQLVLVMVYDLASGERSLHYWAPSWHVLGDKLKQKKENMATVGQNISYGHPTLGKTIFFTGYNKEFPLSDGGKGHYTAFDSVEIMDRVKPYPEDIHTKMPSLDLCVKVPTPEEMDIALFGAAPVVSKEEVVVVAPPKLEVPPVAEPVVSLDTAPTTEPVIVTAPIGETKPVAEPVYPLGTARNVTVAATTVETKPVAEVTSAKPLNLDDFSF